jgi:hypothetical protein
VDVFSEGGNVNLKSFDLWRMQSIWVPDSQTSNE